MKAIATWGLLFAALFWVWPADAVCCCAEADAIACCDDAAAPHPCSCSLDAPRENPVLPSLTVLDSRVQSVYPFVNYPAWAALASDAPFCRLRFGPFADGPPPFRPLYLQLCSLLC